MSKNKWEKSNSQEKDFTSPKDGFKPFFFLSKKMVLSLPQCFI